MVPDGAPEDFREVVFVGVVYGTFSESDCVNRSGDVSVGHSVVQVECLGYGKGKVPEIHEEFLTP